MVWSEVLSCTGCGRPTRYQRNLAAAKPGVLVRQTKGPGPCSSCSSNGKRHRLSEPVRLRAEPLTGDEVIVLQMVQRRCGDDANEVASLLGLIREEVSA